jgi:putative nucleotidyltransferase with HDIG domain
MAPSSKGDFLQILLGLSRALDLVAPALVEHHKRVAYLADRIAQEVGADAGERATLVVAALLHDIGSLSLDERLHLLEFEREFHLKEPGSHAEVGYHLLREYTPLSEAAEMVRHHHLRWDDAEGVPAPRGAHILHLADRVAVLLLPEAVGGGDPEHILETARAQAGRMFDPRLVEALEASSRTWGFWEELTEAPEGRILGQRPGGVPEELDLASAGSLARLFGRIIDFRSPYTATHASGVSSSAVALADLLGVPTEDGALGVAGFLHDLGKLAVPTEILEKPGKLDPYEFQVIRQHPFHTFKILEPLGSLDGIREWTAHHHERMDGKGYPFRLRGEKLAPQSRILAAADVFTALTEARPYRGPVPPDQAMGILREMARDGALDPAVVATLERESASVGALRHEAQERARGEYQEFRKRAGL